MTNSITRLDRLVLTFNTQDCRLCIMCLSPYHGPINHGLATPFLSYRVTLSARKMQDFIRDLIIWQSYKLGFLRQCSDS